jgi:hypothetical protein
MYTYVFSSVDNDHDNDDNNTYIYIFIQLYTYENQFTPLTDKLTEIGKIM